MKLVDSIPLKISKAKKPSIVTLPNVIDHPCVDLEYKIRANHKDELKSTYPLTSRLNLFLDYSSRRFFSYHFLAVHGIFKG